jgi:hypothetical protein
MPTKDNPILLRSGFATARQVATRLNKSLSTIHRMVDAGDLEGTIEGGVLYVTLASLELLYRGNAPMLAALAPLKIPPRKVAR